MSEYVYKIVFIGTGAVGKSTLIIRFISDKFIEDYDPTLEDSYRKQFNVDGEECILDIFDTAGQENFAAVRDQYMKQAEGFACIYSITDQGTFDDAIALHARVLRIKEEDDVPFVLVGNKCDLESDRVISYEKGESLGKDLGCCFLESSALLKKKMLMKYSIRLLRNAKELGLKIIRIMRKKRKRRGLEDLGVLFCKF